MVAPSWFWPPSGQAARGVALIPYASSAPACELLVPDWRLPQVWPFTAASGFSSAIAVSTGTDYGFSAAAPDGSGGAWIGAYDGVLHHLASGFVEGPTLYTAPSGRVYVGTATIGSSGFTAQASGGVYVAAELLRTITLLGSFPTYLWGLGSSGSTLVTLLPASGLGVMDATTGATGLVALPGGITVPSCLTAMSGVIGIGGWAIAPALSGAAVSLLDPQNPLVMAAVGSGFVLLWGSAAASGEAWAQTQALTGLTDLIAGAWRPDGTQIIAASRSSGQVQVIEYSAGVLSLAQSIPVVSGCSVMITDDSAFALVAQSGQAQVATLTRTLTTWSSGTPVTGLAGITAVAALGPAGAVATYSSGVAFLDLIGGVWSIAARLALAFTPTVVTVDPFLQVYAAGSGQLAVASSTTLLGSGSWSGAAPTAIAVHNGRVVLAVPSDGSLYLYGQSDIGAWTQQGSTSLALGSAVGLGLSDTVLFVSGSGATALYGFSGTPFVLTPVVSGAASQWNGSSWTTTVLGIGHQPSCCTFDASGNLQVATVQNTLWSLTSGGVVASSGIVTQYTGQEQTVPIGASSLLASGASLYVATSLPGVLVQVA